ncbi:MAG: histidine triad nucleotide-binding protein [Planctomycetes bacterium]|nr:histidine triad nucleotide-binding protein [Planctomycetota bacterium]MCD7896735.1 histidine triad nucleotide-binding protein [Planctomycetaceae bacterium]
MDDNCIFCNIIKNKVPCTRVYEDDSFMAFVDINPAAPVHILVVPKRHVPMLSDPAAEDPELLGNLLLAVRKVVKQENLKDFRLIINNGAGAGQTVFHLHAHILGGIRMPEKLL